MSNLITSTLAMLTVPLWWKSLRFQKPQKHVRPPATLVDEFEFSNFREGERINWCLTVTSYLKFRFQNFFEFCSRWFGAVSDVVFDYFALSRRRFLQWKLIKQRVVIVETNELNCFVRPFRIVTARVKPKNREKNAFELCRSIFGIGNDKAFGFVVPNLMFEKRKRWSLCQILCKYQ
jgi:hypothetical protein